MRYLFSPLLKIFAYIHILYCNNIPLPFHFVLYRLQKAVTTKMVVKSALIHGGLAKKSMEELYALMSNHSLHVPSPLRLLRISNGKCCEFCLKDKVNHIRPGIGVFACWDCVTNNVGGRGSLTKVWKTT